MNATNPYASQLGERDCFEVIAATSARLRLLNGAMGAKGVERSLGRGKWTGRQILCHLADTEIAFSFRLRQALAQDDHVIQPFDQDAWAKNYSACSGSEAVAVFGSLRSWNISLIKSLGPEAFERRLTHPERGEMKFRTIIETMAGHDLNHLSQLEKLTANTQ